MVVNWKKGFKRLTWAVSILLAGTIPLIFAIDVGGQVGGDEVIFFIAFLFALAGTVFGVVWAIYYLVRFVVIGFLDTDTGDKLKRKDMNLKRAFRRIALVLAVVVAIVSLSIAICMVRYELYAAQLQLLREQSPPDTPTLDVMLDDGFDVNTQREDWLRIWEKVHQTELERCRAKVQWLKVFYGALIYGAIGFCGIWFIYRLLKWLGFGVRNEKPKNEQKQ